MASNFTSDSANWQTHTSGFDYKGEWTATTAYVVDDVVQEGGNLYICTNQHTSTGVASAWYSGDFPGNWELYAEGLNFRGNLTTNTYYGINDVVTFGVQDYRCTVPFQVAADIHSKATDPAGVGSDGFYPPAQNFNAFSAAYNNEGSYISTARYERGDIVEWKGSTYVAIGTNPVGQQPNENTDDWKFLNLGIGTGGNDA